MKTFIAFALLVAGISGLPQQFNAEIKNERIVTDAIASAIEDFSQEIVDAGLDPLYIQYDEASYALPVSVIFSVEGVVEEFLFKGLSEIVINSLSYSIINSRLSFDLSLPLIEATLGKAEGAITFFGEEYTSSVAGSLKIKEINVKGDVRVSVGIISGISVRSIDLNFKPAHIESNLKVTLFGNDVSDSLNIFIGTTIKQTLDIFENEVNELLEIVVLDIINANL